MYSKRWGLMAVVTAAAGCSSAQRAEPATPSAEAPQSAEDVASCAKGRGDVCLAMGNSYLDGNGVVKDRGQALEYFRKACDANNAEGCSYAAELTFAIGGESSNVAEAHRLREKACQGSDSMACNNLGSAWANGTEGASKVDFVKARSFYEKSCQLKNPFGCFNLGNAYRLGEGADIDMNVAMRYFELSCGLGGAKGCTELAIVYYEGSAAPKDTEKAVALFDKGCKLGSDISCQNYRTLTAKPE